jgi:Ca2+-binding RTX toxin-like protein
MRRAFLIIPAVLAATLAPSFSNAEEVYMCLGHEATIVGTPGDDDLVGTDGPDVIVGLRGKDAIAGRGGPDLICGGPGDDDRDTPLPGDVFAGRAGLDGGADADLVFGGWGDDQLHGSDDKDRLLGGSGNDALCDAECWFTYPYGLATTYAEATRHEFISKDGGYDDRMFGGPGADLFLARDGDEILSGGRGDDRAGGRWLDRTSFDGEQLYYTVDWGNDTYFGGPGNDRLSDSDNVEGNDFIDCGSGIDGPSEPGPPPPDPTVNCSP